ncbi:MAG TPA: peptidoglycan-binding domain-containing protein [Kofleriaceae bacterium]
MAHERETDQRHATADTEAHGDHADDARASGDFTSKGAIPPVGSDFGSAGPSASDRAFGAHDHAHGANGHEHVRDVTDLDAKDDAERRRDQRFDNDAVLEEIAAGTRVIKNGDTGRAVTKLQVALMDLGYLKGSQVDGDFRAITEAALKKYQAAAGLGETGEFDAATLGGLRTKFESRKPYVALSQRSSVGVHKLEDYEKDEAIEAMVPRKPGDKFSEEVAGEKYGPKIETRLAEKIAKYHGAAQANAAKRDKPKENFHSWADLEGPCQAAKVATDKVYGSYKQMPAFSNKKATLNDFYQDQKAANATLEVDEKKEKAENLVRYMINSQCADINKVHHADVDADGERAILDPIVASLVDTEPKVQILLEVFMDWPGAARGPKMFLQRYKSDTDDKNREQLWQLFHIGVHEYIHTLKHQKYTDWANELGGARYHTLIEGFCDFFTLNVRSQLSISAKLQEQVEGTFYDKDRSPPANADGSTGVGVYRSHAQAEQVVSIVGVRNAQEAYFEGDVAKMGAS